MTRTDLLLPRELGEHLGVRVLIDRHRSEPRTGRKNSQVPLPDLVRQSIYSRLAGYEDTTDADADGLRRRIGVSEARCVCVACRAP